MIFFDTSVYVAATVKVYEAHEPCAALIKEAIARGKPMACGVHTMSELYSVLTRLPPPDRVPPSDAWAIVERIAGFTKLIALKPSEEMDVIQAIASRHLVSGIVHDAALLQCARKADAKTIYTLNVRHFRLAAPDLADRLVNPLH